MRIDPIDLLLKMPYGSSLYSAVQLDKDRWEIAWLLREEVKRCKALGPSPWVQWRCGAIEQDGVLLIPVLLSIGTVSPEHIWEVWINHHQHDAISPLFLLAEQDRLTIHFYDHATTPVCSIQTSNGLRDFSIEAVRRLADAPRWTMAEFDRARQKTYKRWPSVMDLWNEIHHR